MSDVSGSAPKNPGPGEDAVTLIPFPYRIVTDYAQKMMIITVDGTWEGFVDQSGIIMTVDTLSKPGYSLISLVFTGAEPGALANTVLTKTAPDKAGPYALTLSFIG